MAETLEISPEHIRELVSMFKTYCAQENLALDDENKTIKYIRRFLKERKPAYKELFKDTLLGQSGCFPASLRACLLAGAYNVETHLARSTRPLSTLHVLLMRADGSPFELTNFEKHEPVQMTLGQIRAYARFAQPVLATVDDLRHRHSPSEQAIAVRAGIMPPDPTA